MDEAREEGVVPPTNYHERLPNTAERQSILRADTVCARVFDEKQNHYLEFGDGAASVSAISRNTVSSTGSSPAK
jgi:hypothetical protein